MMTKMIKRVIASVLTLVAACSLSAAPVYAQSSTPRSSVSVVRTTALKDNGSKLSSGSVWVNGTVTATAKFTGGTAPYQYQYSLKENGKSWSSVSAYVRSNTHKIKVPNKIGYYTVRIVVRDAHKKTLYKDIGLTVKKDTKKPLNENGVTINSTDAYTNGKITVTSKFSGGVQPYRYAYAVKQDGKNWSCVSGYVSDRIETLPIPKKAGKYVVRVSVRDASGKSLSKYFNLRLTAPRKLDYGSKLRLTVPNEGKNTKYSYYYRNEKNSAWRTLKQSVTYRTVTCRPNVLGKNYIRVVANTNGKKTFCDYTYTAQFSQAARDGLKYVNQERKKAGKTPLVLDAKLTYMASIRSEEIQTQFDHIRPNGTSCFTIFDQYRVDGGAKGENIAYGYPNAKEVTQAWMNSKGHRENILRRVFTKIGIGKDGTHWTQLFSEE